MTLFYVLGAVTVVLALIGYVTCLRLWLWITLVATAALAGFVAFLVPFLQTDLPYWAAAGAVVLACVGVALKGGTTAPSPTGKATPGIIIDGTNVIYWDNQTPQLETLRAVVDDLKRRSLAPTVFLDASTRHHLKDKTLNETGFAAALGIPRRRVMVCPAGTEADVFILKHARETGQPILSNDRFGDRAQQLKGLKIVKGVIANGRPVFDGL